MDNSMLNEIRDDFETAVFELECIANLFQLIGDCAQEGGNSMDCYKDSLWYVGNLASKNSVTMKRILSDLQQINI